MTDEELDYIIDAVRQIALHYKEWEQDYTYDQRTNEFYHQSFRPQHEIRLKEWFDITR